MIYYSMLLHAMTIKNLILCYEIPMPMYKISMLWYLNAMLCYGVCCQRYVHELIVAEIKQ